MRQLIQKIEGTMSGAVATVAAPFQISVSRSGVPRADQFALGQKRNRRGRRGRRGRIIKRLADGSIVTNGAKEEALSGDYGTRAKGYGKGGKIYDYRTCPDGHDFDMWTGKCVPRVKEMLLAGGDARKVFWKMIKLKQWEKAVEALGFVRVDKKNRKLKSMISVMLKLLEDMVYDYTSHSVRMIRSESKKLMKAMGSPV